MYQNSSDVRCDVREDRLRLQESPNLRNRIHAQVRNGRVPAPLLTRLVFSSSPDCSLYETKGTRFARGKRLLTEVCTPLKDVVVAVRNDDVATVRVVLDCGLDPGSRYNTTFALDDRTLLHWAARYDSSDSAEVFDSSRSCIRSPFALRRLSSPEQT